MEKILQPQLNMVFSVIGFIICAVYTASGRFEDFFSTIGFGENFGLSLGFAMCLVFIMIFIGSFMNMVPTDEELNEFDK